MYSSSFFSRKRKQFFSQVSLTVKWRLRIIPNPQTAKLFKQWVNNLRAWHFMFINRIRNSMDILYNNIWNKVNGHVMLSSLYTTATTSSKLDNYLTRCNVTSKNLNCVTCEILSRTNVPDCLQSVTAEIRKWKTEWYYFQSVTIATEIKSCRRLR